MSVLSIDGVPIAELDATSADILKGLAKSSQGRLLMPLGVIHSQDIGLGSSTLSNSWDFRRKLLTTHEARFALRWHEEAEVSEQV